MNRGRDFFEYLEELKKQLNDTYRSGKDANDWRSASRSLDGTISL